VASIGCNDLSFCRTGPGGGGSLPIFLLLLGGGGFLFYTQTQNAEEAGYSSIPNAAGSYQDGGQPMDSLPGTTEPQL
jgi:hypothetical protein